MAKKKMNVFDLDESELKTVSKKIIKETVVPSPTPSNISSPPPVAKPIRKQEKKTAAPVAKIKGKPGPVPKIRTEGLKVLRVRESYHKKAKRLAFDRDILIQDLIEELIEKRWDKTKK